MFYRPSTSAVSRVHGQDGFTLIELLVASAMMVIITGAAVTMLISSMHRQSDVTSRADQIGNARNAIEKITADIREGESASIPTPSSLQVTYPCEGSATTCPKVSYTCKREGAKVTFECVRETSAGVKTKVVSGLSAATETGMFCVYPNSEGSECGPQAIVGKAPRYVGVTVRLPSSSTSEAETVLQDGAALHNSPDLLGQ
jgi:prepilin-type N-terminal cleavage/methylation domain-containing protein